jgi:vacuolar-type H+-ATPase subunit I/STV1
LNSSTIVYKLDLLASTLSREGKPCTAQVLEEAIAKINDLEKNKKRMLDNLTAVLEERADNTKVVKEYTKRVKSKAYNLLRQYCQMDTICEFERLLDEIAKEMENYE